MTRTHKLVNLAGVTLPLAGLLAAIILLWERMVGPRELAILAVGYVLTGVGITVGYHRLFTHRSFQTFAPVRYAFAVLGQMAVEGPVVTWVADHRKHHQFSDVEGDPHSPHAGFGDGLLEAVRGLWHAHTGWIFSSAGRADHARYAKDLLDDRGLRLISRLFGPTVLVSLVLPALVGWLWIGGRYGFVAGLVWGGAVRILLLHHVTWSINSICHFFGRRQFRSSDESRNVWWLSLVSFGESWHNNHHAFPTSAFHGMRRLQLATDPGAWVICALEKTGLAWRVTRIPEAKQAAKSIA
ncbi:MAG: acyl-CoA desaturase [Pseudomonadota bacterium]